MQIKLASEKKYNHLYEKIKNYQLRKLQIERNPNKIKYTKTGDYSNEYYALNKAKKDIKDKIKEILDAALVFSEIIQMGEFSKESRKHDLGPSQKLDLDNDFARYELTGDQGNVREKISNEALDFVRDVFNEDIIQRLLNVIFYHGYSVRIKGRSYGTGKKYDSDKSKNYRIIVAKKIVERGIEELKENLDHAYFDVLSQDLNRAVSICNGINRKISDEEWKEYKVQQMLQSRRRR